MSKHSTDKTLEDFEEDSWGSFFDAPGLSEDNLFVRDQPEGQGIQESSIPSAAPLP